MSVLKIVFDGDPVLRKRAAEVEIKELTTPKYTQLLEDMLETMYAANGVGIAAPQIGESVRIFIAESGRGPIALVNPVFTKKSWKLMKGEEGCLSVPGKFDKVMRYKSVSVEAFNAHGEHVAFTADGFFARVLQHEMDHLDGMLYVDRVKEQKK